MKKFFKKGLVCTMVAAVALSGIIIPKDKVQEVQAADDNWELVWCDEFNGNQLDESVWTYEEGTGNWGWGNGEVQYYRKENVSVSGGYLQIQARKENYEGCQYTSGRIISMGKKYFQYGKMEARIKVENGNQAGVWPAYWMMGENMSNGVGWPNCGEIDIMEHANASDNVCGTLHWNTKGLNGSSVNGANHGSYGSGNAGKNYVFSDNTNNGINGWHTYALIWDKKHMEWVVDGETYFSQSITSNNAYCFRNEFFFLFNLAIGGTGTGFTNYTTADYNTFQTTTMFVDYLRVYQLEEEETTTAKVQETTTKTVIPTTTATQQVTTVNHAAAGVTGQDAVQTAPGNWEVYYGSAMSASGTETILDSKKGVTLNATTIGTQLWGIQAHINNLTYIAGATYNYSFTITSDVDKVVRVKVVGDDDNHIIYQEDITVKAGVPYYYNKDIVVPADYDSVLNLYFGLGKTTGDTLSSTSGMNLTIKDVAFTTNAEEPSTGVQTNTAVNGSTEANATIADGTSSQAVENQTKTVVPRAKIKKAVRAKSNKKITIQLKAIKGITGYQIKYSTSKKLKKKVKTVTTKKNKRVIKKLKANKKYYIKVRAYKTVKGKKIYGKWSKIKTVKVKK